MKRKILFLIFVFSALCAQSYASGGSQAEKADTVTQNDNWILCITNFDVSTLPSDKKNISSLVTREIARRMSAIEYRTRISPEYAYYEDYAWTQERTRAAAALSAKIEERSALIYRGDTGFRYRQNIARIDGEIETLREKLNHVENNAPLINSEPLFSLSKMNLDNIFPDAPSAGNEYRYCASQGVDGFLAGSIIDFYGRYFLSVKLYAVYSRAYIFEDAVIFSLDDIEDAILDISRKLLIALSGSEPAHVAIRAVPEDTLILINGSFAGRGEIARTDFPPGVITITASAPDHEGVTFQTEISQGETVDISISLNPVEFGNIEFSANTQGNIYHGALYAGETPMQFSLPVNSTEYFEFISPDSQRAALIFQSPSSSDFSRYVSMNAVAPLEAGKIERERSAFYWSLGGTWLTGIAAWVSYYTFMGAENAIRSNFARTGTYNQGFYDNYRLMNNIYTGSLIAVGAASAYGIYRLIRYIYYSTRDTTPSADSGSD